MDGNWTPLQKQIKAGYSYTIKGGFTISQGFPAKIQF